MAEEIRLNLDKDHFDALPINDYKPQKEEQDENEEELRDIREMLDVMGFIAMDNYFEKRKLIKPDVLNKAFDDYYYCGREDDVIKDYLKKVRDEFRQTYPNEPYEELVLTECIHKFILKK